MLIIRPEQMKAFQKAALRNLSKEMVERAAEFAPFAHENIGRAGVARVVDIGIESAERHGLTEPGPVRAYIEIMFLLGTFFDSDPQYPWAPEILSAEQGPDQVLKADRLHARTAEFMESAAGPDNSYLKTALSFVGDMTSEDLPQTGSDIEEVYRMLTEIYPEKTESISREAVEALVAHAKELMDTYRIESPSGIPLFTLMMVLFGWGCFRDPRFPWIAESLSAQAQTDPAGGIEQLYSRTKAYTRHMLAFLAGNAVHGH